MDKAGKNDEGATHSEPFAPASQPITEPVCYQLRTARLPYKILPRQYLSRRAVGYTGS